MDHHQCSVSLAIGYNGGLEYTVTQSYINAVIIPSSAILSITCSTFSKL